jgi:HSP20 family protein
MANGYLTPSRRGSLASGGGFGTSGSLFDLHRQMNRLFDDLFEDVGTGGLARTGMTAPAMEVHQSDDKLEITAELPGVKEEDVDLTVEDGVLTLRGEKKYERTDEERGYSERSYGTFERRITLPSNIDEDKCTADFKDGVLTISMPKSEKARGRRIPLGQRKEGAGQQRIEAQNDRETRPLQEETRPMQQAASEERRKDKGKGKAKAKETQQQG